METNNKSTKLSEQEVEQLMKNSPHLKKQSYDDIPTLTPSSPQVISRQATLNIGTIGHVAHGKSTVVKAISSVNTVRFKPEMLRNITIRLGYANAKIYKCQKCPEPECFKSFPSSKEDDVSCDKCESKLVLLKQDQINARHISFVDCPGHDILLSTMLTGAAVMDAALLLIAANMDCPQPQTSEHLVALDIVKLDHIIILQNKVDIIFKDEERALENYKQIKQFIKSTRCQNAPIIPISAQLRYNIDAVCQSLNNIPIPKRSLQVPPKMIIIRSFDVNKPGCKIDDLVGGVVGGSILQGVISVGMEVEIRPGQLWKDENGNIKCTPIRSRVVSLLAENNELLYAVPGGLIGVGLLVDPSITRNDKLVGSVLGAPNSLPDIFVEVDVKFYLMRKLLGVKNEGTSKQVKIQKLTEGETLKFNVGSTETPGQVVSIKDDIVKIKFTAPICTTIGEKVAFSRRIEKSFRLIGWGEIKVGKKLI